MSWNTVATIGAGLLALSAFLAAREHTWISKGQVTEGTVIELVPSHGNKGTTYAPKVRFASLDGSVHEFKRSYYTNPPGFRVGEKVTVAYDTRSYEGRILTFGQRFGFPAVIASVGLALAVMGWAFIFGRTVVPRCYLQQSVYRGIEPDRRGF